MFHICSHNEMSRIDETLIVDGILSAPGWARLGIAEPKAQLRRDAASELARAILARVFDENGADPPEPSTSA